MQLCRLAPPGTKPSALASYDAVHEAHEFARDVAMKPGRPERILSRQPARRENHEVDRIDARRIALRLQHEEDRRIGMIEADRTNRVEVAQIVFVRRVIAVPRDHVERRMTDVRAPQIAVHLRDQFERALAVFVRGVRREEIARIGKAVRADRSEFGQTQQRAEVLADIAARLRRPAASQQNARRAESPRSQTARRSRRPSSVASSKRPSCGTISNSPSAL